MEHLTAGAPRPPLPDGSSVAKLNVDEHQRAAQRFGISSIPALYIFKGGRVVERLVGAQPESVLRQALARHTGA
jgi:thioredoxin 1